MKHLEDIPAFGVPRSDSTSDSEILDRSAESCSRLFEAIRRMMHLPFTTWWSHPWVIQECAVAREILVVYGTISAPWPMLTAAASNFLTHRRTFCADFVASLPHDHAKSLSTVAIVSWTWICYEQLTYHTTPKAMSPTSIIITNGLCSIC
jgi:hypothetical protein